MTLPTLWVSGTSIERGSGLASPDSESWPARLDVRLVGGRVRNLGVGGGCMIATDPHDDPAADVPETIVSVVHGAVWTAVTGGLPRAVIIGGPINDLIRVYDTGPIRWATLNLARWLMRRGILPLVATITPYRQDAAYAEALSARRQEYNTWVAAQFGDGNGLDTAGQILHIGDVLCAGPTYAHPQWMRDGLHPNEAGMQMLADAAHTRIAEKGLVL